MNAPFEYRSLSFHQSWPNLELIRRGAELGFNDLTFQTEGGTLSRLSDLRERADQIGYFRLARDLGFTITVWVHEFNEVESDWGALRARNRRLWDEIRSRYEWVLGTFMPEIDQLALTVVETGADATQRDVLLELVATMHDVCRRHGKRLILRTFVHHPEQQEEVIAAIGRMPDDLVIMTKCVPQDWHLRHVDHPLIGNVGGRLQFVEVDVMGEYWREDRLANCFTGELERQFRYWAARGIGGISVRVDRGWEPWKRQASVLHEAQEANLWILGMLASGATDDPADAWQAYATREFGAASSEAMIAALRPTGRVVEESLCVGRESFGNGRQRIPAVETMRGQLRPGQDRADLPVASAYDDAEDALGRNPFHRNWSVFRWDPAYREAYQRLRRGDPAFIEEKRRGYTSALRTADECLRHLDAVRGDLPPGAHAYFRFRLEENRLHLIAMCEMELAWLKAERRLYTDDAAERARLLREIEGHLAALARLDEEHGEETLRTTWAGRHRELLRFAYVDIPGFVREFRRYFGVGEAVTTG